MTNTGERRLNRVRAKIFNMVSTGVIDEPINRFYDFLSIVALVLNLFAAFAITFDYMEEHYKGLLLAIEAVTTFFFAVDYLLRLISSAELYPKLSEPKAAFRYIFSMAGIIDLLSFLPYYLPVFFPAGGTVFRLFRVARILRLFRINSYYDQLNVITEIIVSKSQQLLASVFIILILMMASSLCMYSVEHEAQPDVFENAFSGFWWSVSTLLTVGYGDIYPITALGKLLSIAITILGVGIVAIPTGIISAGFVEEYNNTRRSSDVENIEDIKFVRINITKEHSWVSKQIRDLKIPEGLIFAAIIRKGEAIVPKGDTIIMIADQVVLAAQAYNDDYKIHIREIELKDRNPWLGHAIKDIDISRHSLVLMIKRGNRILIPKGNTILKSGDCVFVYSKKNIQDSTEIDL